MFCFIFILLIASYSASGKIGLDFLQQKDLEPYCFKFSWLGYGEKSESNCSDPKYENIPCIEPIEGNQTFPNFTDIWNHKNRSEYGCFLRSGYSCIKYTYNFNKAVVNSSYFCGKMVRDTINVVENGCFTQNVGGYEVEVCACRSKGLPNEIPCNSSVKNYHSLIRVILIALASYFIYQNA